MTGRQGMLLKYNAWARFLSGSACKMDHLQKRHGSSRHLRNKGIPPKGYKNRAPWAIAMSVQPHKAVMEWVLSPSMTHRTFLDHGSMLHMESRTARPILLFPQVCMVEPQLRFLSSAQANSARWIYPRICFVQRRLVTRTSNSCYWVQGEGCSEAACMLQSCKPACREVGCRWRPQRQALEQQTCL